MASKFKIPTACSAGTKTIAHWVLLMGALFGLAGCGSTPAGTANILTDVAFLERSFRPSSCFSTGDGKPPARNCSDAEKESLRYAELGKPIKVFPLGEGTCAQATIDFGDGSPPETFFNVAPQSVRSNVSTWMPQHTYSGWPGKKLVRVKGDVGCLGNVTKELSVGVGPSGREDFRLGFCVGTQCPLSPTTVCSPVMTSTGPMPPIRRGTGVRIATDGQAIDYGSNQIFNASGDPTAPVPAGYLFPRRKKFSLVYRIGTTDFQGEAGPVTFIADQTAPLEICTNDNPGFLTDNRGQILLTITVNERSAQ